MCTPHCPTYSIYQLEAESPRGRISIIQALSRQQLAVDDKTLEHLNHCLGCRACESICPSKVPFMALMDKARQLTTNQHGQSKLMGELLKSAQQAGGLGQQKSIRFIKKTGLASLASLLPAKSGISQTAALLSHNNNTQFNDYYPASAHEQGSVLLFTGCMGTGFNSDSLSSSIKLLTHYGFNVHMPDNQHCCGALHQHNGDINTASELAEKNKKLFQQYQVDALIYLDSGCGSQLSQSNESPAVYNLMQFILQQIKPGPDHFKACNQSVWLHESCSLKNSLMLSGISHQLLRLIPELSLQTLNHAETCCGAGGSHLIKYPDLAHQLLDQKLTGTSIASGEMLVSDNIGCSLHFKTGLKQRKINIEVIHPVTLLSRQLK